MSERRPARPLRFGVVRLALFAMVSACAPRPATQIVVRVFTDVSPTAGLTGIHVLARRVLGGTIGEQSFDVSVDGLPGEVTLVPSDPDDARPVRVELSATFSGGDTTRDFTLSAIVSFVAGRTQLLNMVLARRCTDPTVRAACGSGTTCGANGCDAIERPQLPDLTRGLYEDAGYPCTVCRSLCVHLDTDVANCGVCGQTCDAPEHGQATCIAGRCGFACESHYASCGGDRCDTAVSEVVDGCSCERACTLPQASARCVGGHCAMVACTFPWGDCDGVATNGCEIELTMGAACGRCGNRCQLDHAEPFCVPDHCDDGSNCSRCDVGACNPGFGNCNYDGADGCEADLRSDAHNCGACGQSCRQTELCREGTCVPI